jgi:hypothetical protein
VKNIKQMRHGGRRVFPPASRAYVAARHSWTAAAAIIAFAGVAAARLLAQRAQTWSSSGGTIVTPRGAARIPTSTVARPAPVPSVDSAAASLARGDAIETLRLLAVLRLRDSTTERFVADSLIAIAAPRAAEIVLGASSPNPDALQLILTSTSAAIVRAHPGTAVLAPLSLARATACMGGRLNCPAEQVREDLAWAILLGTPMEQDQARRLRAALVGDTVVVQ